MKRSGLLLIVLGIFLALISGLGVMSVLNNQQQVQVAPPTPIPTLKIVVAAQNIPDRTVLQANMLALKEWPQYLVPSGILTSTQALVGEVTNGLIVAGEPVLTSKVGGGPSVVGLAPSLPPGLVAMNLELAPANAVGGAIEQGDSVDVLLSMEYTLYDGTGGESKPLKATFYTIQDVMILASSGSLLPSGAATNGGTQAQAAVGAPVMLTVLVTPQDALLLKHAREQGTIDVVLRSPQFHDQVVTDPVYLDYIMRRFDLPKPAIIQQQTTAAGAP